MHRWPFFTVLFGVMCILIFALQIYSDHQYKKKIFNYCEHELTAEAMPIFKKIGPGGAYTNCIDFIINWDTNLDHKKLDYFAYKTQLSSLEQQTLVAELKRFNTIVLHNPLTSQWWHDPLNSEITQYITSSFLHADWEHLLFNLLFFFAFSIVIEQLMGSVIYLLFFVLCCLTTGIAYESNLFGIYSHLPTLGLSGVVMGLMTLTACIYPLKRMAVFLWILLFFTTIRIPVILLVGFYVLTDIYGVAFLMDDDNVNYIAHLAGAFTGIAFAFLFYTYRFFSEKQEAINDLR